MTFHHPKVVHALDGARTFRLDATRELSEEAEGFLAAYRIYGVPTVLLFGRDGRERREVRILGFVNAEEFLDRFEPLME